MSDMVSVSRDELERCLELTRNMHVFPPGNLRELRRTLWAMLQQVDETAFMLTSLTDLISVLLQTEDVEARPVLVAALRLEGALICDIAERREGEKHE